MKTIDDVAEKIENRVKISLNDNIRNKNPELFLEIMCEIIKQEINSMLDELEKEFEHGKYNETGNPAKVYWVVSLDKIRQKILEMKK